jgi:hypothetical protein
VGKELGVEIREGPLGLGHDQFSIRIGLDARLGLVPRALSCGLFRGLPLGATQVLSP